MPLIQKCRYIYIKDPKEKEVYKPVPNFYNKDLKKILKKAIRSSALAGVARAQATAILAGAGDNTTWNREEEECRCELEEGPPHGG